MGVGHFMRMLALSEEWKRRGGRVIFGGAVPKGLRERAEAPFIERAGTDDAQWTITQARISGCSFVAADGYSFGLEYQRVVQDAGLQLLLVDDNGENREYAATWILNVNAHARETMYARRAAHSRLLLGSDFLLLRSAILRARRTRTGGPLLVSFGGADPADATKLTLAAITSQPTLLAQGVVVLVGAANGRISEYREAQPGPQFRILVDPEGVADIMASAGVCICSPSTTFWEMSYLQVPCIGLVVADNQKLIAEDVRQRGLMRVVGDARLLGAAELGDALKAALSLRDELERMAEAAGHISDGRGASRVVDAMLGPTR